MYIEQRISQLPIAREHWYIRREDTTKEIKLAGLNKSSYELADLLRRYVGRELHNVQSGGGRLRRNSRNFICAPGAQRSSSSSSRDYIEREWKLLDDRCAGGPTSSGLLVIFRAGAAREREREREGR